MVDEQQGGCLCGDVRYAVNGAPKVCLACHCTFCQRFTSSAYSSVAYFDQNQVHLRTAVSEYVHRSDETGRTMTMQFCARCGVTVAVVAEARPGWVGVQIGTLDEKFGIRIQRHVWTRSKQRGTVIPEDVDEYDKGSADGAAPTRKASRRGSPSE